MFRIIFYSLLLCAASLVKGQVIETIVIDNGSFEDVPRQGGKNFQVDIKGWFDCGRIRFPNDTPPDIHPGGFWENNLQAIDGNTYLGLVVRDDDSYEGVAQRLSKPLEAGQCYEFSVHLAKSPTYLSGSKSMGDPKIMLPYTRAAVLRVWGGTGFCSDKELLAETQSIDHSDWKKYDFSFKPRAEYRYIMLEVYYKTPVLMPYNGHILVDKLTDLNKVVCPDQKSVAQVSGKASSLPPHKRNRIEESVSKSSAKTSDSNAIKPSFSKPTMVDNKRKILEELDPKKIKAGSTIEIKNLYFKADSTNFTDESREVLDEIADFLLENSTIKLEVGGHSNGVPPADYCDRLSTDRAKSVYEYLVSKGVSESKLTYKGYGKRYRKASDATAEGRRKNQRVELKVTSV